LRYNQIFRSLNSWEQKEVSEHVASGGELTKPKFNLEKETERLLSSAASLFSLVPPSPPNPHSEM